MSALHRVQLPRDAVPKVVEGQPVDPDSVLATVRSPGEATPLPIAGPLLLPPDRVGDALAARPGTVLAEGETIARGGRRREVRAPTACLVLGWDRTDGTALVAPLGAPEAVLGHVGGVVEAVDADAIVIRVRGRRIDGMAGSGGPALGPLRIAVRDPGDELRAAAIDVTAGGQILVGGSRASAEALIRARAMGVAGIVLAGALDKELRDFEETQRRRREVGGPAGSLAILLLAGHGKVPFDPDLLVWFGEQEGRLASLFGAERRLYVYDAGPPPVRRSPPDPGDRVIATHQLHGGLAGVLVRTLDGLHRAPSGAAAPTGMVRFDDGRVAAVPLPNLEASLPPEDG